MVQERLEGDGGAAGLPVDPGAGGQHDGLGLPEDDGGRGDLREISPMDLDLVEDPQA